MSKNRISAQCQVWGRPERQRLGVRLRRRPAVLPPEVGLDTRQRHQVLAALLARAELVGLSSSPFSDC